MRYAIPIIFSILAILFNILPACDDNCEPEEYECKGDQLRVCDSDNSWRTVLYCSDYENIDYPDAKVICCESDPKFDGEPNCTLEEECNGR